MNDVLVQIEAAGRRCRFAADKVDELLRAPPVDPGAETMEVFREAERAFRNVVDEILPMVDALPLDDLAARKRVLELRRVAAANPRGDVRNALFRKIEEKYGEVVRHAPVQPVVGLLTDCMQGIFCAVELSGLADNLQYLVAFMRAKHSAGVGDDSRRQRENALGDLAAVGKTGFLATVVHGHQTNIFHSPGAAVAVATGPRPFASATARVAQEEHEDLIRGIRRDLIGLESKIDEATAGSAERLDQALRMIAKLRVEHLDSARRVNEMKETLDEVWAQALAPALRGKVPSLLPEVLLVLAKYHPLLEAFRASLGL